MNEKIEHYKVLSSVMMKDNYVILRHDNGSFTPSNEMIEALIRSNDMFREPIIEHIDKEIGDKWAVRFSPYVEDKIYDVRVYCETQEEYDIICFVIINNLKHLNFEFNFMRKGSIDNGIQW